MMFEKKRFLLFQILMLIFLTVELQGQILGPELTDGAFEIGCAYKRFHRKVNHEDFDWGNQSVFFKHGITDWLTLCCEGLITVGKDNRFPERNYRDLYIGAGVIVRLFRIGDLSIATAYHYSERFMFDRSVARFHKDTRSRVCIFQLEYTVSVLSHKGTIWAGPGYILDEVIQFPWGTNHRVADKSKDNVGFAVGTNVLLFDHIEPFFHLVYADYYQPRLGIGWQF